VFLIKHLNILNKPIKTDIRISMLILVYRMALNYNYLNFFFKLCVRQKYIDETHPI